jgi:hypothetical protein
MTHTERRLQAQEAAFIYLVKKGRKTLSRPTPAVVGRDLLIFKKP